MKPNTQKRKRGDKPLLKELRSTTRWALKGMRADVWKRKWK